MVLKVPCTTGLLNADVGFPMPGWSNSPAWKLFISGIKRLNISYIPIAESGDMDSIVVSITDNRVINGINKPKISIRLFTNEMVAVTCQGFHSFDTSSGCPYRLRVSCDSHILTNDVTVGLLKAEARYSTSNSYIPIPATGVQLVRSPNHISLRHMINSNQQGELPCDYAYTAVKNMSRRHDPA